MERCPTCDKLKQNCPYKGKHPKPQPKPTTGTLSITSTPSDASVKIDGRYLGTTPLTLDKQNAGTYKVTFSAEGYETQTKSVTVTAGKTATCSATLRKKQAQLSVVQQPVVQQPTTTTTSSSSQTITANGVSFKMIRVEGGTFTMGRDPKCDIFLNDMTVSRNHALIESLRIPYQPGLNVLTGETGAGKSIVDD